MQNYDSGLLKEKSQPTGYRFIPSFSYWVPQGGANAIGYSRRIHFGDCFSGVYRHRVLVPLWLPWPESR